MNGVPEPAYFVELARRASALLRDGREIFVLPPSIQKFCVVYPFAAHALEQVAASLLLCEHGHAYAAEANVRVAFEHAITCQWIVFTHGGEIEYAKRLDNSRRVLIDSWKMLVEIPSETVAAFIESRDSQERQVRSFEQRLQRFTRDAPHFYGLLYRFTSESVHPSKRTVDYHAKFSDSDALSGIENTAPTYGTEFVGFEAALSAMLAVGAVAMLIEDSSLRADLQALTDESSVPWSLDSDDTEPERRNPVPL